MATRKQASRGHPATSELPHAGAPRQGGRAAGRARRSPWPWIVLAILVLVGGGIALTVARGSGASGRISAAVQSHDFGKVPIHGGVISTRFPLTLDGDSLVTELTTS